MITVRFSNPGGELDSRVVKTFKEAAAAAIEMIQAAGELDDGDSITVEGEEE